jgi:hypothetical protein
MFNAEVLTDFNSEVILLSDAELDQVAAGFLQVLAGVAVGAALGAGLLVAAVVVGDGIRHAMGKSCILDSI